MRPGARRVFLALTVLGAVGVLVLLARQGAPGQGFSLRAGLDRAVEAKAVVNRAGQRLIRLSDEDEMALGDRLVAGDPWLEPQRAALPEAQYLQALVDHLVRHGGIRRPGLRYRAHLVDHPMVNAFAVPGGRICVTTGMLGFVQSEAELVAILGHELAHIDLRHGAERLQAQVRAEQVGLPLVESLAALGSRLMHLGYQDEQELEADRWGMTLAAQAGYHPQAARSLFQRLAQTEPEPHPPTRPLREVAGTLLDGAHDLLASHPYTRARIASLAKAEAELGLPRPGVPYRVGIQSLKRRTPCPPLTEAPDEHQTGPLASGS